MATFYPANVPLVNYFFQNFTLTDPGPNIPLAGGFVFFRDDEDHTVDKPTFSDVSDPNDPVVNPNPLPLNDVGAWPLFYAEEGLYYIVITGSDGDFDNPIWTLEHVDFAGGAGASGTDVINYISNGQFLLHNDLPAVTTTSPSTTFAAGQIRAPITDVAYGGWTFERPDTSTATDFVTFPAYTEWSDNPTGNPRFAIRIRCTNPDSIDGFKDLRFTIPNVNRFANDLSYTIALNGVDNLASSSPVDVYVIKNFGTGGSPETQTLITTFNLASTPTAQFFAFNFGDNSGKVIGTDNDDYLQLAFRLRTDENTDVTMTDFNLQAGALVDPPYPETTQRQDVSTALGGGFPVPAADGSDLLLTPRLTLSGWIYDDSEVGDFVPESQNSVYVNSLHPTVNRMLADGNYYRTTDYSPIGIPFSRLQSKYWVSTLKVPRYGTGSGFVTLFPTSITATLFFTTNAPGSVTAPANGAINPGFTFTTVHVGNTYNALGYFLPVTMTDPSSFLIQNTLYGSPFGTNDAGTSTFAFNTIFSSDVQKQVLQFGAVAASGLAGLYFQFSNTTTQYYVWFKVAGSGADPAPGGTGIEVDLATAMTRLDVRNACTLSVSGYQVSTILFVAASAITAGSYWTFATLTTNYYVWYRKGSTGADPVVAGRLGILVQLAGTETAAEVATATQAAINGAYFGVPDARGMFIRGWSNGATVDPDVPPNADTRFSTVPGLVDTTGDVIGSEEFYDNAAHVHHSPFDKFFAFLTGSPASLAGGIDYPLSLTDTENTDSTGIGESRPTNLYANYVIKY